jgi:hypothetical protein
MLWTGCVMYSCHGLALNVKHDTDKIFSSGQHLLCTAGLDHSPQSGSRRCPLRSRPCLPRLLQQPMCYFRV